MTKFIENDKWYALLEETYKPDKTVYIENKFHEYVPGSDDIGYDKIMELVSRSDQLQEWYEKIKEDFSLDVTVPRYVSDLISGEEYDQVTAKILNYKASIKETSEERRKLAEDYKRKLDALNKKEESDLEKVHENDLLYILTIPASKLPLKTQLLISNYTPMEESDPINKRTYAREQLLRFRRELIEIWKSGGNVKDYVSENALKL